MRDLWIPSALVLGLFIAQGLLEAWLRRRIERSEDRRRAAWVADPAPGAQAGATAPVTPPAPPDPGPQPEAPPSLAVTPVVARRRAQSTPVAPRKRAPARPRFESTAT